ncbi:MAG: hypothetical protein JWN37_373 [Candidatus Nomurabacteria bacterium]|nr:hypothetical protein [Candidatus Nomurabacteria bacterium]
MFIRLEGYYMNNRKAISAATEYLLGCTKDGICQDFFQLRHGPSLAWTTACVASSLAEFGVAPKETLEALLALQGENGGWSYNERVPADADTTLRVLQFLSKVGFRDRSIVDKSERFVLAHQGKDGGVSTYLPATLAKMGYPIGGWAEPHPCVTALAANVVQDPTARFKAGWYITKRLAQEDPRSYWWRTPWYVRYEAGFLNGESISSDPVEISLALLLKSKLGIYDRSLMERLLEMQLDDGSFPVSQQFRIPRPTQTLEDIDDDAEVVEDNRRVFSTSSAVVAMSRQTDLR